jgi:hypothetical protein
MKIKNLLLSMLSILALSATFTSCDDDEWDATGGGVVEFAQTRAFILNEGSYGANNSSLYYMDWKQDTLNNSDIYLMQNQQQLGDVGQDIIAANGNIYVTLNGSNYIAKLNSYGMEKARFSFNEYSNLGSIRYVVESDGFLYVSSYGGYVSKINATSMEYVDSVKVGANPEGIAEANGKIYCINGGWGYDNRLSVIDKKTFKAENYETTYNGERVLTWNGRVFIQGYGAAYPNYDYQIGEFDTTTKTYTRLFPNNVTNAVIGNDKIYMVNSVTDWSTYTTNATFFSYDLKKNELNEESFLVNAPAELATSSVYGMSVNSYTGDIYILTSSYTSNGIIYHFSKSGEFVGKYSSNGISPRKIVFLK